MAEQGAFREEVQWKPYHNYIGKKYQFSALVKKFQMKAVDFKWLHVINKSFKIIDQMLEVTQLV